MADALSQGESRTPIDVQRLARILAVLADPTRLRMIRLVAKRELSGIDIAEALGISQALACHHLAKLVGHAPFDWGVANLVTPSVICSVTH